MASTTSSQISAATAPILTTPPSPSENLEITSSQSNTTYYPPILDCIICGEDTLDITHFFELGPCGHNALQRQRRQVNEGGEWGQGGDEGGVREDEDVGVEVLSQEEQ
ncbi:hypothetical protein HK102_005942, partial [Quaeritorhiza haematococci]